MRNFQLSFFSIIVMALLQNAGTPTPAREEPKGYLHGITPLVWVLVVLQAGDGLLVAAVIKYADNVIKGLATGVSMVAPTVFSMIIFGTPLSNQFSLGAVLILLSVYFFANDLASRGDDEMEAMLPSK
jgi:UDP-sugar transporter A1/2/3